MRIIRSALLWGLLVGLGGCSASDNATAIEAGSDWGRADVRAPERDLAADRAASDQLASDETDGDRGYPDGPLRHDAGSGADDFGSCSEPPELTVSFFNGCVSEDQGASIRVLARDPCGATPRLDWELAGRLGQLQTSPGEAVLKVEPGADHPCPYRVTAVLRSGGGELRRTFELWVRRQGDVNRDGRVDASDLLIWNRDLLRTNCCERGALCAADVDKNCVVDAADHAIIVQQLSMVGCTCP